MEQPLRILMVEDSPDDALLVLRQLSKSGHDPVHTRVETAEAMEKALREETWDLILCDYQLPRFDGLSAISLLKKTALDIPLIIVSGVISAETAVAAMKAGASDYIMKDNLSRLVPAIERELKEAEVRRKARQSETQRKEALEALQREKDFTETIVQSSPTFFVAIDGDGKTIMMNDAFLSSLGYTSEEVVGLDYLSTFVPESDRKNLEEVIESKIRQNKASINENRVRRKDGGELLVEWHGRPVFKESGEMDFFFGIGINITERKQAEKVLRQSEERFRLFAELAPVGIVIADQDLQILYANQKFMELFGYDGENVSSVNSWWSLAYPDESLRKRVQQLWEQDIETALWGTEEISPREFPVTCRDGIVRQVEFRLAATEGLVLLVCSDITDRKTLEAQLSRAQKLESVGTLAGGIAHDFNNLLMGIQGYASLMLLDLHPSHPHFERLKHIEEQVASGAALTKQLLGFARGGRFEAKVTSMNDIVEKTAAMFGRTKKEIAIQSKLETRLWNVEVDRTQMEQVFMNLYVNAWQAMPGGGSLYLETENVLLDEEAVQPFDLEPGPYVCISVTDTGVGMDKWTRERIFDPFFSTKPKSRGTGLGLTTTYGIIRGHKGMINVYSEPGVGSRFSVYLPVSTKDAEEEGKEHSRTLLKGEETILLVDDESAVRDVSREMIESLGYRVHTASNGQDAVALYLEKKGEIDLVVLDMIMPGISGGETFDRLREINPEIKIILASGYSIEGEAEKILDRGCDAFLQKPFLLAQLSGAIRDVLDRKLHL